MVLPEGTGVESTNINLTPLFISPFHLFCLMSPELENLIKLYAALHESPADERDVHFKRLCNACEEHAAKAKRDMRTIFAFAKRQYFAMITSESKRTGRPQDNK